MRDALEHLRSLRAADPAIQAEYERLGPRFEAIRRLIAARKKRGLTQSALAREMGVSQSVVARLESGEHSPRLDTLASAAAALGCRLRIDFEEPAEPRS